MGDCVGATQHVHQRTFPVTAFDLVTMVSLQDLQSLLAQVFRGNSIGGGGGGGERVTQQHSL